MEAGNINVSSGDVLIGATIGNYNVSGGTITLSGTTQNINTTPSLWNLVIDGSYTLSEDLTVLNNLTINASQSLNASGNTTLTIGGDFTNNGTYTTGTNTTKFAGAGNSSVNGNITFSTLELDFDNTTDKVNLGTGTIAITKLKIAKGTLDVGTTDRNISDSIYVVHGEITGTNALVLNGSSQQTIKGGLGLDPSFGNLKLNNSSGLLLLSNVDVNSFEFQVNSIVDLDIYNLKIEQADYTSGSWSSSRMFKNSRRGK